MELINNGTDYTIEDCQMALKTAFFEREYDRTLGKTAQLLDEERRRILHVDQLLLRFDNENLQLQLNQFKQDLSRARNAESDIRNRLQDTIRERDQLQSSAHIATHEIEGLRRELASMNSTTAESRNLVTEKLRLTKELANMQSEVHRLQLQTNSFQALVTEKQELTRHLNTLKVEFENEKRAHRSTMAQGAQQADEISVLTAKLEEQRKQIAAEARKVPATQQPNNMWQSEKAALEDKVESLNRKLRTLKDELRQAQTSNQTSRFETSNSNGPLEQTRKVPLKDFSSRFDPGLDIATPGAVRVKEGKRQPTAVPGQKSAFSITPFLNRTNGNQETSGDTPDNRAGADRLGSDDESALETSYLEDKLHVKESETQPRERRPIQAKQRLDKSKPAMNSRQGSGLRLDDIDDDSDIGSISALVAGQPQIRTKRRKLGAQSKTILDEEEELEPENIRKPGRKIGLSTGHTSSLQTAQSGPPRGFGGFGGFSPLKKERKRP
ncbi:hypothetical protein AtubIFM55763_005212 [Aspergillus tubingensis]|nr:probable serine-O-acetyltransferase cys2 [Aspergillus tubingensis]GFN21383.1 probable serine-O-acetyltransferase cys2 [Aspergillus tubingensis]GLA68474.1 hypothetical protein AtubIFM55763_005212 [Aspergillus tubingensis]GLA83799.1 hypothetical protein AtubIFM56815_008006 [Aspergillus tubingensis]